jgi:hypothetical protein
VIRRIQPPTAVQVAFNISNFAISAALSCAVAHAPLARVAGTQFVVLAFSAFMYWSVNTGLVSVILALEGGGNIADVWRDWCIWSLPYYLAGGALATVLAYAVRGSHWPASLLMLPMIGLTYLCYRLWLDYLERRETV